MDMGIVNAGQMIVYDDIDPELRQVCEDSFSTATRAPPSACWRWPKNSAARRSQTRNRISPGANGRSTAAEHALVHGITEYIEADTEDARQLCRAPAQRHRRSVDGRMNIVGASSATARCFCAGGEIRPRDETGVAYLMPFMEEEKARQPRQRYRWRCRAHAPPLIVGRARLAGELRPSPTTPREVAPSLSMNGNQIGDRLFHHAADFTTCGKKTSCPSPKEAPTMFMPASNGPR